MLLSEAREHGDLLEQFEPRQILRIDDADGGFVVVDDDEVVDAMLLKQVQDFDREFVLMDGDRVECHQIGDKTLAHFRVGLKMAREIAVGKNAE